MNGLELFVFAYGSGLVILFGVTVILQRWMD